MILTASAATAAAASDTDFMAEYYLWHNSSSTRWVDRVPLPVGQSVAGAVDWVVKGAVTKPTSQGRCATCQSFSCIADVEGKGAAIPISSLPGFTGGGLVARYAAHWKGRYSCLISPWRAWTP